MSDNANAFPLTTPPPTDPPKSVEYCSSPKNLSYVQAKGSSVLETVNIINFLSDYLIGGRSVGVCGDNVIQNSSYLVVVCK